MVPAFDTGVIPECYRCHLRLLIRDSAGKAIGWRSRSAPATAAGADWCRCAPGKGGVQSLGAVKLGPGLRRGAIQSDDRDLRPRLDIGDAGEELAFGAAGIACHVGRAI